MAEINKIKVNGSDYDIKDINSRFYGSMVPFGTSIGANADLNTTTYLKVGNYYCSADVTVATLSNCPTGGRAFMMQVFSPLSTTVDNETTSAWVYRVRKIQTYTGLEFTQVVSSGATKGSFSYGAWTQTVRKGDLGDQVTYDFSDGVLTITSK